MRDPGAYADKTIKSEEIYEEAKKVLPGGVTYSIRSLEPHPLYVVKGKGSHVWDVDGNEYTDYWMGHGAIIMGHGFPPVIAAAREQLELGAHLGFSNEWEVKHARQITEMVPSAEMVRPTNSGTEANMYSTRLARAYTGRKKIVKFEGHWHGGYDALHKGVSYPYDAVASAGLHEGLLKDTVVVPFNDIEGVRRGLKGIEGEIASVVLEPVAVGGGVIPADQGFLEALREFCDGIGALLIFDEVVTGFRLAPGGAQELYGVTPDLTVLGKAVGGSIFPAGAFCGRGDIMERIDHVKYKDSSQRSFHGGTYAGNPLTSRAGYTLLKELQGRRSEIYPALNGLGKRMVDGLEDVFSRSRFQAHVTVAGSLFGIHFSRERPRDVVTANTTKDVEMTRSYHSFMLSRGTIFLSPDTAHCMISAAHTTQEIDEFVSLTEEFVRTGGG
jgi:glutamate-1-semialdehyde 2,1-aminomutase